MAFRIEVIAMVNDTVVSYEFQCDQSVRQMFGDGRSIIVMSKGSDAKGPIVSAQFRHTEAIFYRPIE